MITALILKNKSEIHFSQRPFLNLDGGCLWGRSLREESLLPYGSSLWLTHLQEGAYDSFLPTKYVVEIMSFTIMSPTGRSHYYLSGAYPYLWVILLRHQNERRLYCLLDVKSSMRTEWPYWPRFICRG